MLRAPLSFRQHLPQLQSPLFRGVNHCCGCQLYILCTLCKCGEPGQALRWQSLCQLKPSQMEALLMYVHQNTHLTATLWRLVCLLGMTPSPLSLTCKSPGKNLHFHWKFDLYKSRDVFDFKCTVVLKVKIHLGSSLLLVGFFLFCFFFSDCVFVLMVQCCMFVFRK